MYNSPYPERFAAPAPGSWELETVHLSRPLSRWVGSFFPAAATAGFRAGSAHYGLLLECMEFGLINGFAYTCARGVGAPKEPKGPPPKLLFKILLRLHPELRRRVRRSAEVFATKAWREDVARWENDWKPSLAAKFSALQKIDARQLSDRDLAAHLETCRTTLRDAVSLHHRLNPVAMIGVGDFLVHVRRWTSLSVSDLLPLMRGASAVSLGASPELQRLAGEIEKRPDMKKLVMEQRSGSVLEALIAAGGPLGEAAKQYVDACGIRVMAGYDVADVSMGEIPELIVDTIRAAVDGTRQSANDTIADDIAHIRAQVPAEHREEFDALLHEARLTYCMRDERGYNNDAWATGIARRALLAAGERLVQKGHLHATDHVFDLTPEELASALAGGSAPSADEVAAYFQYRTTKTVADAPANIGPLPVPPPPAEWLPAPARRLAEVITTVLQEMFAHRAKSDVGVRSISGFAASPGEFTGPARLVLKAADMANIKAGEVLITRSTGPSYNALLPLLRGIVTDRGGTLSHAAVVAREYGIPAVVGTGNATELIPDGAMVRVDGTTGEVHIIS